MYIQYSYTILYVSDVLGTLEFYKKAFGFEQKFLTPENDYGEIRSGSTTISFANFKLGNSNFQKGFTESKLSEKPFGVELAFTTSEVEKVMKNAIASGAVLLEETVTKPWGQKVGYLRDLNGFIIEICTPIQNQE
ncbi:MAG: VOC family protein [Bacteroidota bacterium]